MLNKNTSRSDKIAIVGIVVAVVLGVMSFIQPELRAWFFDDEEKGKLDRSKYAVYIHISNEIQRNEAGELRQTLINKGYKVSDRIDNVGNDSPDNPDVRYYYADDLSAAKDVIKSSSSGSLSGIRINQKITASTKGKKGTLMLYFSKI